MKPMLPMLVWQQQNLLCLQFALVNWENSASLPATKVIKTTDFLKIRYYVPARPMPVFCSLKCLGRDCSREWTVFPVEHNHRMTMVLGCTFTLIELEKKFQAWNMAGGSKVKGRVKTSTGSSQGCLWLKKRSMIILC